jgi:hypothetical protein
VEESLEGRLTELGGSAGAGMKARQTPGVLYRYNMLCEGPVSEAITA